MYVFKILDQRLRRKEGLKLIVSDAGMQLKYKIKVQYTDIF